MLHDLIHFAGMFTPVTIVASYYWGHSSGFKDGEIKGRIRGWEAHAAATKPLKGPNGKFVKKGAA